MPNPCRPQAQRGLASAAAPQAPDEVWNAWSRFWQTAAEHYGTEYATIAKFAASSIPTSARALLSLEPTPIMPFKPHPGEDHVQAHPDRHRRIGARRQGRRRRI